MKNKSLLIILGICVLLTSCFKNTEDQQQNDTDNTIEKYTITIHDRVMSSNDSELIKHYKTLQSLVLKGDYKKVVSLVSETKDKLDAFFETYLLLDSEYAIKKNPEDYSAYNNRAVVKYDFNDKKGALKDINKALKINPYYYIAYLNKADIEENIEKYDEAEKDYDLAIKYSPYNTNPLVSKGTMLYKIHSYDKATEAFTRAIELEKDPYTIIQRGLAYYHLNNKEKFLEDAKTAEKMFKKYGDDSYKTIQTLLKDINDKSIEIAEKEFYLSTENKTHALFPNTEMSNNKSVVNAKKYYEALFNPKVQNETIIKYRKAYNDLIKGNYKEAKQLFDCQLNVVSQKDSDVNQKLCDYYSWRISGLEAEDKIKDESSAYLSWYVLGEDKANIYDKKGAIRAFTKSIELNPYYSEAYYYRALIEKDDGAYEKAIKDIDLAIQYDPYNADLYYNAVQILWRINKELQISNSDLIDKISEYIDKAVNIAQQIKYLTTRAALNITLYGEITENRLQQAHSDILLALEKAKKNNDKEYIEIANKILDDIIESEKNYFANSLVPRMQVNNERKDEIMKQAKKFK